MPAVLSMNQPIAGVTPPQFREAKIMTVWPSLAASGIGRGLGRLYGIRLGVAPLTLGHAFALMSIPIVVTLYFWKFLATFLRELPLVGFLFRPLPGVVQRYVLTNRRVMVQSGLGAVDQRWVELDRFDSIAVVTQPGQEWYRAGDLVFKLGPIETFRLEG